MGKQADLAQASWEKHTKGIGSRLMEKMGFTAGMGLGKNQHVSISHLEYHRSHVVLCSRPLFSTVLFFGSTVFNLHRVFQQKFIRCGCVHACVHVDVVIAFDRESPRQSRPRCAGRTKESGSADPRKRLK